MDLTLRQKAAFGIGAVGKDMVYALSGELELVGPSVVTAEGGMCASYVRTRGRAGSASLTVHTGQTEDVTVHFTVEIEEEKTWT